MAGRTADSIVSMIQTNYSSAFDAQFRVTRKHAKRIEIYLCEANNGIGMFRSCQTDPCEGDYLFNTPVETLAFLR